MFAEKRASPKNLAGINAHPIVRGSTLHERNVYLAGIFGQKLAGIYARQFLSLDSFFGGRVVFIWRAYLAKSWRAYLEKSWRAFMPANEVPKELPRSPLKHPPRSAKECPVHLSLSSFTTLPMIDQYNPKLRLNEHLP